MVDKYTYKFMWRVPYHKMGWDLGQDPFLVMEPGITAFFELGPGPRPFLNLGPGTSGTWGGLELSIAATCRAAPPGRCDLKFLTWTKNHITPATVRRGRWSNVQICPDRGQTFWKVQPGADLSKRLPHSTMSEWVWGFQLLLGSSCFECWLAFFNGWSRRPGQFSQIINPDFENKSGFARAMRWEESIRRSNFRLLPYRNCTMVSSGSTSKPSPP